MGACEELCVTETTRTGGQRSILPLVLVFRPRRPCFPKGKDPSGRSRPCLDLTAGGCEGPPASHLSRISPILQGDGLSIRYWPATWQVTPLEEGTTSTVFHDVWLRARLGTRGVGRRGLPCSPSVTSGPILIVGPWRRTAGVGQARSPATQWPAPDG